MPAISYDSTLVIQNTQGQYLLIDGCLPVVTTTVAHFWQTCEPVNQALLTTHGIHAYTVRQMGLDYTETMIWHLYHMITTDTQFPASATWVGIEQLPIVENNQKSWVIADLLAQTTDQLPAWYHADFYYQVPAIVAKFLSTRAPLQTLVSIEQVRSWERSSIIRVKTSESTYYMKHIPTMFAYEPALTKWLSDHYPTQIPVVSHAHENTLWTESYSGESLYDRREESLWMQALTTYATFQQALIGHQSVLLACGVPIRDMAWIKTHLQSLLTDEVCLGWGINPLSPEELTQLRASEEKLLNACDTLANSPIPLSLEHGDFWSGQIIINANGNFIFTDWSDSTITHPFFSAPFFLAEVENELPEQGAGERITQAYLSQWQDYAPMHQLEKIYRATELISPLFTSLRYAYDILPQMAHPDEMVNMLPYNLRLILRALTSQTQASKQR